MGTSKNLFMGSGRTKVHGTTQTREGWPLLTVKTEVNGVSKSTNEKRPFLGWFAGLVGLRLGPAQRYNRAPV